MLMEENLPQIKITHSKVMKTQFLFKNDYTQRKTLQIFYSMPYLLIDPSTYYTLDLLS